MCYTSLPAREIIATLSTSTTSTYKGGKVVAAYCQSALSSTNEKLWSFQWRADTQKFLAVLEKNIDCIFKNEKFVRETGMLWRNKNNPSAFKSKRKIGRLGQNSMQNFQIAEFWLAALLCAKLESTELTARKSYLIHKKTMDIARYLLHIGISSGHFETM